MRVSPTARLGSGKQQQPAEHFSANAVLSQRLWLGAKSTLLLLPHQGFSRDREEELQEVFALSQQGSRVAGELVSLGPCFPGLHVGALDSPCQAELSRHSHNPEEACVA